MSIKNIIVVNDFDYINGGAGKVAIMSAVALSKEGKNVVFFCGESNTCDELLNSNVEIVCTNQNSITNGSKVKGFIQGIRNPIAEKKLIEIIKRYNVDETVVHFHAWSKILSSSLFKATKKIGVSVVITGHDYGTVCPNGCFYDFKTDNICLEHPLSFKCICKNCDKKRYIFKMFRILRQYLNRSFIRGNDLHYIYISKFSENIIKKNLPWKTTSHFVLNPIDVDFIKNTDGYQCKTYLYIGRVSQEKGLPIFCEAIEKLNYKGIVIGDGPILMELKEKHPSIEFVGWKSSNEISNYVSNVTSLVFPSRWYEAAPLTIPEVMGKFNLPCIVSNACAGQDYIDDDINGLIFMDGNVEDLINKMKYMDNRSREYQNNIANNFDRSKYSMNTHAKSLIKEYDNIIKLRSAINE